LVDSVVVSSKVAGLPAIEAWVARWRGLLRCSELCCLLRVGGSTRVHLLLRLLLRLLLVLWVMAPLWWQSVNHAVLHWSTPRTTPRQSLHGPLPLLLSVQAGARGTLLIDSITHKGVEREVTKQNIALMKLSTKPLPKKLCIHLIGVHMTSTILC
jgi:hypothetical protein